MSNYLAVATVTATLQRILQAAVQNDVEGARVTTVRPTDIGNGTPETGINLFLYQVITNPALNNMDSTPQRSRGNPTKRQAALDLYYMFSFYGNDSELEPQRLLGSIVRTLNDQRVISQEVIRAACRDSTLGFLPNANLADQIQQISIIPLDLNLEDFSKAWSIFFQCPYWLSMAYKILVVMIEGEEAPTRGLPIRDRRMNGMVPYFHQPQIDQVCASTGATEPILIDTTLTITGKQLKGEFVTKVRVCDQEVVPNIISDNELSISLSQLPTTTVRAGIQSLQVIHANPIATGLRQRGVESNAAPFVLRPRLLKVTTMSHDRENYICKRM
jgi:hypothetical protein